MQMVFINQRSKPRAICAAHDLRLAGLQAHGVDRHDVAVAQEGSTRDGGLAVLQPQAEVGGADALGIERDLDASAQRPYRCCR